MDLGGCIAQKYANVGDSRAYLRRLFAGAKDGYRHV